MRQTILVVEDDRTLAEALSDSLELEGYQVIRAENGVRALEAMTRNTVSLILTDVQMDAMDGHTLLRRVKASHPDIPVILMTAYATVTKAVEAMRDGAADYLVKPFEAGALAEVIRRHAGGALPQQAMPVAEDAGSLALLQLAQRVAASDATVLISGESGTGKEVLARYIHNQSGRAAAPFVAINCAAIPENMLEATLFGYEKGAFTGAHRAVPGKFEQAQDGTLLLDEVSEMALPLQAKLLRVLQEREVERLGGGQPLRLNVRVLATSNRDMRAEVGTGRFREDLFYRLNVFPLQIRPLRERRADILPLAQLLLTQAARKMGRPVPQLGSVAQQRLCNYPWPGNVRELDNLLQRALILQNEDEIRENDLLFESVQQEDTDVAATTGAVGQGTSLDEGLKGQEYSLIVDALRQGNRKAAADLLGISPRTLRYKLARLRDQGYAIPE